MSILNLNKLLAPVSDENPCGEDLEDLTEYHELEDYVKGKEETQFSEAVPPEWKKAEKLAQDLLLQGKHMWVISHLICAMTANHGIAGLNQGAKFLSEALSTFWEGIFPETYPEDANPYETRMNVLSSLADFTSPLMVNLRQMPICRSRQFGEFSFRDILLSRGELKAAEGEKTPDKNMIEAAVRDTDPEYIDDMIRLMTEAMEYIRGIDNFLDEAAGEQNNTSNITKIEDTLKSILAAVEPWAGPQVQDEANEEEGGDEDVAELPGQAPEGPAAPTDKPRGPGAPAALNSRDDVYALLGEMIRWYEQNEPASPVAMILLRAKTLVGKDFFQIISSIMGPDVPQVRTLFGSPEEHPAQGNEPLIQQISFDLRSRHDILNWLEKASLWYRATEPSSPVPLFLHRAKQLVGKNFEQIISEIADQAQQQVADLVNNK